MIFLPRNVSMPSGLNVSIPQDQHVSILFVSNIHIENIRTVWHRKLCMKTWYSLRSLWILSIFLVYFFWPKMFQHLQNHILLARIVLLIFLSRSNVLLTFYASCSTVFIGFLYGQETLHIPFVQLISIDTLH